MRASYWTGAALARIMLAPVGPGRKRTHMATQQGAASSGIGLGGAVFLVFLVLKLTGHIDWSWWWVTAPLWGLFGLAFAAMASMLVFYVVASAVGALFGGRRSRR
jgi:hypothetical protein